MPDAGDRLLLVLWDIDHTLIETRGVGGRLALAAFQEITGVEIEGMATATGKTETVILAETLEAAGIRVTDEHQRRYADALPDQYRRHVRELGEVGRALPGAAEAIAALSLVPSVVQTVLTGNYREVAAVKLETFHLAGALDLDVGAYAEDAADRADLVPIAQRRSGDKYQSQFTRSNTVLIGDTSQDVTAAHEGGATIVAVASGEDTADDLQAAGARTVLGDLTDTDAVLRTIWALLTQDGAGTEPTPRHP